MIRKSTIAATLVFLVLCFSLVVYLSYSKIIPKDHQWNDYPDSKTPRNRLKESDARLSITDRNIFLPGTNLSVTQFLYGERTETFNASILSITKQCWAIKCDYSITHDVEFNPFTSPFETTVNRTSSDDFYFADGYYDWQGLTEEQKVFDFWINTSNFEIDYVIESKEGNITVIERENIAMKGVGEFDSWKLSGTDPLGYDFSLSYDAKSGLFLYFRYDEKILDMWYNLTTVEIATTPTDYNGPIPSYASHTNNSRLANGTSIEIEFFSPYDVNIIYHQWDDSENLSTYLTRIYTVIPSTNDSHYLYVRAVDSVGYNSYYVYVFSTDYSIPGISIRNIKDNARIKGGTPIIIEITNGNGLFTYNWNNTGNVTELEGTEIFITSTEGDHFLTIYAKNPISNLWSSRRFNFTVDNTPTELTIYNFKNNSVTKGRISLDIGVSEECDIQAWLDGIIFDWFHAIKEKNYSLPLPDLKNGSHQLLFNITDLAKNSNQITILFDIHTSSFDWNWALEANSARNLDFVDDHGDLWFKLTITSKSEQNISLSVLTEDSTPVKEDDMEYVIKFSCDNPNDILFMTFVYTLNNSGVEYNSSFEVYEWVYWNSSRNEWIGIITSFNEVSYSWEATVKGSIQYFALRKTGETTKRKSVEIGGGEIPSFDWMVTISTLSFISLLALFRRVTSKRRIK
ncbi:MAG: hypothetical protein JSV04_14990 [Candidatus Heimdallarchaeota archaeon]|nr:MAG: hypothetical protein JSV04_14990 [Candidatus Heimdallarchaeota archaeon]